MMQQRLLCVALPSSFAVYLMSQFVKRVAHVSHHWRYDYYDSRSRPWHGIHLHSTTRTRDITVHSNFISIIYRCFHSNVSTTPYVGTGI